MEISDEISAKKPKRLTSVVWNHFERVKKADTCYAVCIHCKKKLSGSSNSGTTHLRNHLVRCLKRSNYDVSQILSSKKKRKESSLGQSTLALTPLSYEEVKIKDEIISPIPYRSDRELKKEGNQAINLGISKFDQERSRLDLARMIIIHGYPLGMVEHVGFKIFIKNLQPLFEVVNNSAIELDCVTIYEKEKQKIYEAMHHFQGRINLTVDMWHSPEGSEYICLIAYYIDMEWRLQKKMLNFLTLNPSHNDDTLSEVVIKSLTDWAIDSKLFSMTFDDCSAYEVMIFKIKEWLSQNRRLLKNGELFDVRCVTHLLMSTAQEIMEEFRDVIHKVRESIRHVKSSHEIQGKFYELGLQVGVNCERHLTLDCLMQWNSTYTMLEVALESRSAFSLLQENDPTYTTALSDTEWELASSLAGYMKLFVEFTNVFVGNKQLTANVYFSEICDMHIKFIEWCKTPDDFLSSVAMKIKNKFDKYWSKCSLTLAIAAILDPRFKMKLVEYYYQQIYGSEASVRINEVLDGIRGLFNEYAQGLASLDQDSSQSGGSLCGTSNVARDKLKGFDKFLQETSQNQNITPDLDKYLEEPIFPRNNDFSILNWWKVHTPRYPILSMVARDVLGIPVSTVGPEVAFSNSGRLLDHHRCSLGPDTREAVICGQDWLRTELEVTSLLASNAGMSLVEIS